MLLYVLGLSYQGVADLLDSLNQPLCRGTVYNNVQAAGAQAQRLREQWLKQQAGQVQVLGIDFPHVKCNRRDQIVAVATAVLTGHPLTFDLLEAALCTEQWIRDFARVLGAEILVTDDADGLKTVADHLGLKHQICRAQVNRNVHDLVAALGTRALEHPERVPGELGPQMTVDQFLQDLTQREWIIQRTPSRAAGCGRPETWAGREYNPVSPSDKPRPSTHWCELQPVQENGSGQA